MPAEVSTPPTTLEEGVAYLDEILNPFQKRFLSCLEEEELAAETHQTMGRWIRNRWGLWDQESELAANLHRLGVIHRDDMSSVILTSYHRRLTGKVHAVDDVIAKTQEYWRQEGFDVDAFLERHRGPSDAEEPSAR